MTDKIFVTKENLEKLIDNTIKKTPTKVGPFSMMFFTMWMLSLVPWMVGGMLSSLAILLCAIPFYYIEQLFMRRKNNAETD